jgi:hypothetical protein
VAKALHDFQRAIKVSCYCSFSCILQSLKAPNVRRTLTLIGPLSSALIRPNYAKMSGSMTAKMLGCT